MKSGNFQRTAIEAIMHIPRLHSNLGMRRRDRSAYTSNAQLERQSTETSSHSNLMLMGRRDRSALLPMHSHTTSQKMCNITQSSSNSNLGLKSGESNAQL